MTNNTLDNKDSSALLKVLTAHYNALVSARGDEVILRQYELLLRLLKSKSLELFSEEATRKIVRIPRPPALPIITDEELCRASLDDLERIVTDIKTTRKDLESIATRRFSVPHGSMRSFASRELLVDKLRTLIANERSHETISAVARGHEKRA